jgi:hypothetical protein
MMIVLKKNVSKFPSFSLDIQKKQRCLPRATTGWQFFDPTYRKRRKLSTGRAYMDYGQHIKNFVSTVPFDAARVLEEPHLST